MANTLQRGLSLIELLVAMSIAVILLTIGVPSFVDMITSNTATSYANDLLADLNYARSEAITRGDQVVVCKGTATAANSVCTGGEWENGWKVFVDCNNDQVITAAGVASECPGNAAEEVLRVHAPLSSGWTMRGNNNVINRITFQATGLTSNNGTLVVCKDDVVNNERLKAVVLHITGRARIATDTDNNGTPDEANGAEINICRP